MKSSSTAVATFNFPLRAPSRRTAGRQPVAKRTSLSPIRFVHQHFSTLRHLSPAQAARLMEPYLS